MNEEKLLEALDKATEAFADLRPKDQRVYMIPDLMLGVAKHGFTEEMREHIKEYPALIKLMEYVVENKERYQRVQKLNFYFGPEATLENAPEEILKWEQEVAKGNTKPLNLGDLRWRESLTNKQIQHKIDNELSEK